MKKQIPKIVLCLLLVSFLVLLTSTVWAQGGQFPDVVDPNRQGNVRPAVYVAFILVGLCVVFGLIAVIAKYKKDKKNKQGGH